jgi:hypothetical protein
LYWSKWERKATHAAQDKAHKLGLAPAVGKKLRFTLSENETMYGYITECIVETYGDRYARKVLGYNSMEEAGDTYDCACDVAMGDDEEYNQLMENLRVNGFSTGDMHFENVGYMKDGRLVAIDFDNV